MDRTRPLSLRSVKNRKRKSVQRKRARRDLLLERLEDRMLLTVLGPKLGGIQPNEGDLFALRNLDDHAREQISVRNVAPNSLTLRFDERQVLDSETLGGIRILRSGRDGEFENSAIEVVPGYVGMGEAPLENEVIVRFAESLPDDYYRIEFYGIDDPARGIPALRNVQGLALGDTTDDGIDNGRNITVDFKLDLGPQIIAVVPQPVSRVPVSPGSTETVLRQAQDTIQVFFNEDPLFVENDVRGNPTARSAENPAFYQLIYTNETLDNFDDVVIHPQRVRYDAISGVATLTFAQDLHELANPLDGTVLGPGTFRLRVGTKEALPPPPTQLEPVPQVTDGFGTGGASGGGVDITFTARGDFARAVNVSVTKGNLGSSVLPQVSLREATSVTGPIIHIVLNEDGPSTAEELRQAVAAVPAADALVEVAVAGDPDTDITTPVENGMTLRVVGLGSSFDTATDLGAVTDSEYLLISAAIEPQPFLFDLPGTRDEPGQRDLPPEMTAEQYDNYINPQFGPDVVDGVTTIMYNFQRDYGFDALGNPLSNAITGNQRARIREVVDLWSAHIGVQFLETPDQGITFVSGDINALNPSDSAVIHEPMANFRVRTDPDFEESMLIIDSNQPWSDLFGGDWFQRAMIGTGFMLGLYRMSDLPLSNMMAFRSSDPFETGVTGFLGSRPPEPIFPGVRDIMYAQVMHNPDSKDIDLYRFEIELVDQDVDEPKTGQLTLETFAERQPNSSLLDTVLSLYREVEVLDADGQVVGVERELIARNDDYFGSDSYISMELGSGVYYVAVTAAGNTEFNPVIEDTGWGGTTQGPYELRFSFQAQVDEDDVIRDMDRVHENRPGTRLDGNADGTPGGVYNFWFQTRPLERQVHLTGDGSTFVDGQSLILEDGAGRVRQLVFDRSDSVPSGHPTKVRLPFDTDTDAAAMAQQMVEEIQRLNSEGFGVSATLLPDGEGIVLSGERVSILSTGAVGVEMSGKTIFVDKTSGAQLTGSLERPFDRINAAFGAAIPGDIVRIVANGGLDGDPATLGDNFAYEIGRAEPGAGQTFLSDGGTMEVPKGVTTMIDAGVIFKLRRARIGVGSSTLTTDRSGAALQILGTPHLLDADGRVLVDDQGQPVPGSVYFTSRLDEQTGLDGTPAPSTPAPGDWGGIVFDARLDNVGGTRNLEDDGIFLNYVNHADLRYGGGVLPFNGVDQVFSPIHMVESRPTVTFNRITNSADAAISADPNSFEETNFHSPRYQRNRLFTSDYQRIGPELTGNFLEDNSLNGLFIRVDTLPGQPTRRLTVPARFTNTDIVHVLSENLIIQGQAGQALLEVDRPTLEVVTLGSQPGGQLAPGEYTYKLVFVDVKGFEGRPSEATAPGTVQPGHGTLVVQNLPPVRGNYITRRLYRAEVGGDGTFHYVTELNAGDTFFRDTGAVTGEALLRDPPSVRNVGLQGVQTGGGLPLGDYTYRVVFADERGQLSPASDPTATVRVQALQDSVQLSNLPLATGPYTRRLIYRSTGPAAASYMLVGELANADGDVFVDDGSERGELLDPTQLGVVRARPSARLKIDPGTVVKLEGARIEATFGAQLIAEGYDGQEIIFTSKLDDRYGAGGTFDTNNDGIFGVDPNAVAPEPGHWSGLYVGQLGKLNLDHAYLAFGGGDNSKIEGTFKGFNIIEIHQAQARIANSVIEHNDPGTGGQGPNHRFGRGPNDGATIFVRGSQPVLLNNIIRDNAHVAITINADAFTHELMPDPGRTTGPIARAAEYDDNRGPLVRGNRIANNGPVDDGNVGTNGMEIRTAGLIVAPGTPSDGAMTSRPFTLSTESIWDDTDIVHMLYDDIRIPNFNSFGGLRLQSSTDESLVVKLFSPPITGGVGNAINDEYNVNPSLGAGFTATGRPLEIEDRIGGQLHVVGQPGFPVILTSLHDDTVGAGLQPDGTPLTDTNNNGWATTPSPGDWRSLRMDQFSHDRNVEIILEQQPPTGSLSGDILDTGQFLGDLARSEIHGDDNYRMGFEIHGRLESPDDVDVYTFTAEGGTEIWLDIDRTAFTLDTVVELLDAEGQLVALSNSSTWESIHPELLYSHPARISENNVNPLQKLAEQNQPRHTSGLLKDFGTINERDAGMRVLLPGAVGERSPFTIRVRSSNLSALDPWEQLVDMSRLYDGLTSGVYQLQVRMREAYEFPGSTVRYSEIRYAQNGIELIGLPKSSPLLGEAMEDEWVAERETGFVNTASNDSAFINPDMPGQRPQDLGNLFTTDRAVISLAGSLSSSQDVDFYRFSIEYQDVVPTGQQYHAAITFDMDYADELGRADTTITIFRIEERFWGPTSFTPILIGMDSNIADDRSAPVRAGDDPSGVQDLARGSVGALDPFVGTVNLPVGDYAVAVTSSARLPVVLDPDEYLWRHEQALLQPDPDDPDPDPDDPPPPPPILNLQDYALIRREPINSVDRIAEDHIGFTGYTSHGNQIQPTGAPLLPIRTAEELETHVVPFTLADVPLFVQQGNRLTASHSLYTVNPYAGGIVAATEDLGTRDIQDIAMRSDGILFGYERIPSADFTNPYTGEAANNAGRLVILDPRTGEIIEVGTDNILGAIPTPDVTTGGLRFNDVTFTDQVDALAFYRSQPFGTTVQYDAYYSVREAGRGVDGAATQNSKLYRADPVTGSALRQNNQLGYVGDIQPAGVTFASRDFVFDDGQGAPTTVRVEARAPGEAGNFVIDVTRGDVLNTVNVVGGTIFVRLDTNPPATAQQFVDLLNSNSLVRERVTAVVVSGSGAEAGELSPVSGVYPLTGGAGTPLQGRVTGLAFDDYHGGTMYGITDAGEFLSISRTTGVATVLNETGISDFQGLALGPQNVSGGAYADTLFAVTRTGQLYAFDGDGQMLEIFAGGATSIHVGVTGLTGLAFSPADFNLWHPTTLGGNDAGHGINTPFDNSRRPANELVFGNDGLGQITGGLTTKTGVTEAAGHTSFYFGLEPYQSSFISDNVSRYYRYQSLGQYGVLNSGIHRDLAANPSIVVPQAGVRGGSYNLPGGTQGRLLTNPFSLQEYSGADKPVLYFNYRLDVLPETPPTWWNPGTPGDTFRAYIQRADGTETLVASNVAEEYALATVQRLYNDDVWRQARIELDRFARQDGLRIRYDFVGAGDVPLPIRPPEEPEDPDDPTPPPETVRPPKGVQIDDLIIGFAERGEMMTGSVVSGIRAREVTPQFSPSGHTPGIGSGPYQLEIRRSEPYADSLPLPGQRGLVIQRTFDTNDRLVPETTLIAPAAHEIEDGDTFRLGDGANQVTFEFDNNFQIRSGNIRVPFTNDSQDYQLAAAIRDAINSSAVQAMLRLQATLSDGAHTGAASRSNKIVLFGNASGDIRVLSSDVPELVRVVPDMDTDDDGDPLRDAILGSGVAAVGSANLVGGSASAGLFQGGEAILGLESGIVLSTGHAQHMAGPNPGRRSGTASGSGDADLDVALGVETRDTTSLDFQFNLTEAGTVYLDYVFASDEYNVSASPPDGFAILIKPQGSTEWTNWALVPGTNDPVSTATVNRTTNAAYFNNNDPTDSGRYIREFGYNGFTDVFQVAVPLPAGIHQIKFVISDVGDEGGDSAVFIGAGTLSTEPTEVPPGLVGIQYDGFGDRNVFRDQGQILIHSNTILHTADWGIFSDAGQRDTQPTQETGFWWWTEGETRLGNPHMGPPRNLLVLNDRDTTGIQGGFAPGPVIVNNTLAHGGLGGIHFGGDLAPYELTVRPDRDTGDNNSAGDAINDGDWFSVTVGRITVEFEFQDVANSGSDGGREAHQGGGTNPGWKPGRVPIYYRRSVPNVRGYSAQEMAQAIKNAIDNSILVTNGTTQVARTSIAPSRYSDSWAVYIENARQVSVYSAHSSGRVFDNVRVVPIGHGAQPFGRILNNTIYGTDGSASFYPGDPAREPNDTIFNAIDTRQGRAASPETFSASAVIGDNPNLPQMPSADVDMYQFQLEVGDRVVVEVTGEGWAPELRLFNDIGREFEANLPGAPFGSPEVTVIGDVGDPGENGDGGENGGNGGGDVTVRMVFTAEEGGTYFVSVSGTGHRDFSPLSMGGRSPATAWGAYQIELDVLAPRTWVMDAAELIAGSQTLTLYDAQGRTFTFTTPGGDSSQAIAGSLRNAFNAIPGVSAQAYGGYDTRGGLREPSGNARWGVRGESNPNFQRYVVVHGPAKIEGSTPNALWPILNVNNDSGLLPETGILVTKEATPTVLNNVLANNRNGIIETLNQPNRDLRNQWSWAPNLGTGGTSAGSIQHSYPASFTVSPISAVVGANLFQHNEYRELTLNGVQMRAGNWGISEVWPERTDTAWRLNTERVIARPDNQDFNIALAPDLPLFVNAADGNFFPAPTSRAIDSSVSALEDRPAFLLVKRPMGLPDSPVLAPKRDAVGQLRIDDPAVSPPQGQGQNVFIDRGSLDRSDFVGPSAHLVFPRDNDSDGLDIDPTRSVVHLLEGVYSSFSIQLVDGFEAADPFPGVGVNDATVQGPRGAAGQLPGSAVTVFQNGVFLEEERDYQFRYDSIRNTIHLTPTSGIWEEDAVYRIELNNRDRYVVSAPRGDHARDGEMFQITDSSGVTVTFEYDTGFIAEIPQSLAIQVPRAGVTDGQRFQIRDASDPMNTAVTFEIDNNGVWLPANQPVLIPPGATRDEIARAIVTALDAMTGEVDGTYGFGLTPKVVGDGLVHLGASSAITVDTGLSSLQVPPTIMTLAVREVEGPLGNPVPHVADGQQFSVHDGQQTIVFEFDNDGIWDPDTVTPINIFEAQTAEEVGEAIVQALRESPLELSGVQHVGNGLVHVHVGGEASVARLTSRLVTGYAGRPVQDGERFTVAYDQDPEDEDSLPWEVTFEFTQDGFLQPGSDWGIDYTLGETHEELAERMAAAILANEDLELPQTKHLQNGVVYIGGSLGHEIDMTEAPTLNLTGRPEVQTTTRLNLPRPLTILVPELGGMAITEGETFTITDLSMPLEQQTHTFEFDDGISGPVPGNVPVFYPGTDADELADSIISSIENLRLVVPGFLDGVEPVKVVDADGQIGVQLSGVDGNHSLDTSASANVDQSGGRVADGQRFRITYEGQTTTFELDSDGVFDSANTVILFTETSTLDEIADSIVASIRTSPGVNLPDVQHLGDGVIDLRDSSRHVTRVLADAEVPDDAVTLTGIAGGAVRVPFEPWAGFSGEQMAEIIVDAINANPALAGVSSELRGGNSLFVDFVDPDTNRPADFTVGPATLQGISHYFLRAIQDLPGNALKANQFTAKTHFTILLPGVQLDFGDAPDSLTDPRYPTLFAHDGARHVIADPNYHLGSRVDADRDGQPVPGGLGDDLDHRVSRGTSPLELTGLAPHLIRIPAGGVSDQATFTITAHGLAPKVFEFVDMAIAENEPALGHVAVFFRSDWSAAERVERTAAAIVNSVRERTALRLSPIYLGSGVVFLGGSAQQRIDTRGTALTAEGLATHLLIAVPGAQVFDGQQFRINDGRNAPVIFEFDSNGQTPLGVWPVPFQVDDSAEEVARAIDHAVAAAKDAGHLADEFELTSLGDGRLHVAGVASHQIDLEGSGLEATGHTPVELRTPGAGLGLRMETPLAILLADAVGGGVSAGETFIVSDGRKLPVIFEFTADQPSALGYVPVAYNSFDSGAKIAQSIVDAIELAVSQGRLENIEATIETGTDPLQIHLHGDAYYRLDTSASALGQRGAIEAGEWVVITDGAGETQVFEFVRDADDVTLGNIPVVFRDADSANDMANALVSAIQLQIDTGNLGADIVPQNYGGGSIQIGGDGSVSADAATNLTAHGEPGGVLDGQYFELRDGVTIRRFEFDGDGKSTPGTHRIPLDLSYDAEQLANTIVAHIQATGFSLDVYALGGGRLRFEGDDNDGVYVDGVPTPGATVTLLVTASAPGYLDAWIDFNNDGDFSDQNEHVFASYPLEAGINEVPLTIPSNASIGPRFARFRFSREGGLAPYGLALSGEVEDHIIEIFSNAPPELTLPGEQVLEEDQSWVIAGLSVNDPDAGPLDISMSFSVLHGTLSVSTTVANGVTPADVAGAGTRHLVLTASPAQIAATLAAPSGLTYRGDPNFNGRDLLTVVADDLGHSGTGGPRQDYGTVPLTVLPVNDPPELTVPGTLTVVEDQPLIFPPGSISVYDVDWDPAFEQDLVPADTEMLLVLSVTQGTLTLRDDVIQGVMPEEIVGNGTSEIRVMAPPDRINTTLAHAEGLIYQSVPNLDTGDVLTLTVDDLGNRGAGGPLTDTRTVSIDIKPVNDPPVVTAPTEMFADERTPMWMIDFDVDDVDSGDSPITVTLVISQRSDGGSDFGTLTFVDQSALDFDAGDTLSGNQTSVVTIEAPVYRLSALLQDSDAWYYTSPAGLAGDSTSTNLDDRVWEILTITAEDNGATGGVYDEDTGEWRDEIVNLSDTKSVTLFVQEVNDPPVITAPQEASVDEDQPLLFTNSLAVSVFDPDLGEGQILVTLTVGSGTVALDSESPASSITLEGSLDDVNNALASLRYQGDPNFNGTDTLVIVANDQGNWPPPAMETVHTVTITVNAINDPPEIRLPDSLSVLEDQALNIPLVSVTDVDAFEGEPREDQGVLTVIMSVEAIDLETAPGVAATAPGTLSVIADVSGGLPAASITYSPAADQVTLRGTADQLNTTLGQPGGLVYQGAANVYGQVLLRVFADDHGQWPPSTGESTAEETRTITIVPVNDAPLITAPTSGSTQENQELVLEGIEVFDVDAADSPIRFTLSAENGTISVTPTAGVTSTGDGPTVVLEGSQTDLNATLAQGVVYTGLLHYNGPDTITLTADDQGHYPPPAQVTTHTIAISVGAVNQPPELTLPAPQTGYEDQPLAVAPIAVFDPDVGQGNEPLVGLVRMTLAVQHGTLQVRLNVPNGLVPGQVTNNGSGTVTITAPPERINTTLAAENGLIYQPKPNYNSFQTGVEEPEQLTVTVNDLGNWPPPAQETTGTLPITVIAVNDPPVITAPRTATADEDLPRSIPGISVTDVDIDEGPSDGKLQVTFVSHNGTLTIRTDVSGGVTAGQIEDNGSSQVIVDATPAQLNATLASANGLVYLSAPNFNGTDHIVITADDKGQTGEPNPELEHPNKDIHTITLTVRAINDPPEITAPDQLEVDEDVPLPLVGFTVRDVDAAEGTGNVRMTLAVVNGRLSIDTSISGGIRAGDVQNNHTGTVVVTTTPARINHSFDQQGIQYLGLENYYGPDQLTITVNDLGNWPPPALETSATVPITVHPVNDPPVVTLQLPAEVREDTSVALTVTVDDVEMGSGAIFDVTLSSDEGFFTIALPLPDGVTIAGNGSSLVTLQGTDERIKETLETPERIHFQGNQDYNGPASLTLQIVDRGMDPGSPADDQTVTKTLNFSIIAVNDPPVIQLPDSLEVDEDVPLPLGGQIVVTDVDAKDGNIRVTLEVGEGTLTVKDDVPGGLTPAGITTNGTARVVLFGTVDAIGATLADPDGVVYLGSQDYFGPDTLTVTANDRGNTGLGGPQITTASTPITVHPVNDPPYVANPIGVIHVLEDAPVRLIQLFPGVFEDPDDDVLSFEITANSNPSLVVATIEGTVLKLTFQPDQSGTAVISVTASDSEYSATDTFTVHVEPVNDPPFVKNPLDDVTVLYRAGAPIAPQTVDLSEVFDDPDIPFGDVLTLKYNDSRDNTNRNVVTAELVGTNLILTFTGAPGQADLTVHVEDQGGKTASDTFRVKVNAVPVANDYLAATEMNEPLAISILSLTSDADGFVDPGSVAIVSGPQFGQIEKDPATGIVTYTPNENYWNQGHARLADRPLDTFTYTVLDNDGFESNEATVTIGVTWIPRYQNPFLNEDVGKSGMVSPIDALVLINYINSEGNELPPDPPAGVAPQYYYDVNGDGLVTAADVLQVINYLNRIASRSGEGEATAAGEGEAPLDGLVGLDAPALVAPDYTVTRASDGSIPIPELSITRPPEQQPVSSGSARAVSNATEFDLLAGDGSVLDEELDDILGDIVSDIDGALAESLPTDWVFGGGR